MPKVHFVKSARKANPIAKQGEPYYWWKFNFGPKRYSKTPPRRSQLTQSEFLSNLYDLEDEISEAKPDSLDDLSSMIDDWKGRISEMRDECEEKLNNMPDQLRESDSGNTLQERIDGLESWESEFDSLSLDKEDEESEEEALERIQEEVSQISSGL